MNAKLLSSLSESVIQVLSQFGIQDFKKGRMATYDKRVTTEYVTVLVGITHGLRGNIAYSMCQKTACNIASRMMMGMPVEELDEMSQSAITEMANMITGHAATLYADGDHTVDIAPPNLMLGENVSMRFSTGRIVLIEMISEVGSINLFIGLEEKAA